MKELCYHKKYGGSCGSCEYYNELPNIDGPCCGEAETLKAIQDYENRPINEDREFENRIMAKEDQERGSLGFWNYK